MWINIHRHSMFSAWDGYGRPDKAAAHAKSIGQTALGLTDHGNMCGIMEHYKACRQEGIKPLLGCEVYFQPSFNQDKDRYHLTLIAKNLEGYKNLCKMVTEANRDNFFRYPVVTLETIKRYRGDVIALSGCASGMVSRMLVKGVEEKKVDKVVETFKSLFDHFYLEVMPIDFEDQIIANEKLIALSERTNTKIVMTYDSHFMLKEEYPSYLMMHAIGRSKFELDYSERYMPEEDDVRRFWARYHKQDPTPYIEASVEIAEMCDVELNFSEVVPKIDWGMPSKRKLRELAIGGLKERGKFTKAYKTRLKKELSVIYEKKFEDYFLLVYDVIEFAKKNDIGIGYGRGSVCGSLLAYALGLIEVDPIILGTNFERFLRPNKMSFPDIDTDFETSRRQEVINYLLKKYEGQVAQICTFGYYKVKNLINDVGKVLEMDKASISTAKKVIETMVVDEDIVLDRKTLRKNSTLRAIDDNYKGFLSCFADLYGQVRFTAKHAAGIAITADDISNYMPLMRVRGELVSSYDLKSLSEINVVKVDVLGLATVSIVKEVENITKAKFSYDILEDREMYDAFADGNTLGVFQFEKEGAKKVLDSVKPDNFDELIAATALNRPAPIQLGILSQYVEGKNGNIDEDAVWFKYTQDTYGNIIYQEHVIEICRGLADMDWADVDKVMKGLRPGKSEAEYKRKFVEGSMKNGVRKSEAAELFDKMTLYLFNKGHGAGYTLLSAYCMHLKLNYPLEFFYATLKHSEKKDLQYMYKSDATKNGVVILLPHVNGKADYSIVKVDGERAIQEGLSNIDGIGTKTALNIEKGSPYKDESDFIARCTVNKNVYKSLKESGALEFDMRKFMNRVIKYNSAMFGKNVKVW